jgi:hypothetical protein
MRGLGSRRRWAAWCLAALIPAGAAIAGEAPPAAPAKPVEAEVLAVAGDVTAKRPGQKDFAPVQVGDRLPEKTEISTGLNAECRLKFPTAEIRVEALTTATLDRLQRREAAGAEGAKEESVDAQVRIQFGTLKFKVQKGALKTDLKISTPRSTTAISGTGGGLSSYAGQPDRLVVVNGTVRFSGPGWEESAGGYDLMTDHPWTRMTWLTDWEFRRIYGIPGLTPAEESGAKEGFAGTLFVPPTDTMSGGTRSPLGIAGFRESVPSLLPNAPAAP